MGNLLGVLKTIRLPTEKTKVVRKRKLGFHNQNYRETSFCGGGTDGFTKLRRTDPMLNPVRIGRKTGVSEQCEEDRVLLMKKLKEMYRMEFMISNGFIS